MGYVSSVMLFPLWTNFFPKTRFLVIRGANEPGISNPIRHVFTQDPYSSPCVISYLFQHVPRRVLALPLCKQRRMMKGIQPYMRPSLIILSCWLIFRTSALSLPSSNVSLRGIMGGVDYVRVWLVEDCFGMWLWSALVLGFGPRRCVSRWFGYFRFTSIHQRRYFICNGHAYQFMRESVMQTVPKTTVRFKTRSGRYIRKRYSLIF